MFISIICDWPTWYGAAWLSSRAQDPLHDNNGAGAAETGVCEGERKGVRENGRGEKHFPFFLALPLHYFLAQPLPFFLAPFLSPSPPPPQATPPLALPPKAPCTIRDNITGSFSKSVNWIFSNLKLSSYYTKSCNTVGSRSYFPKDSAKCMPWICTLTWCLLFFQIEGAALALFNLFNLICHNSFTYKQDWLFRLVQNMQ
jgi:hypothetical protein